VLELKVRANRAATPTSRIVRLALEELPFTYEAGQAAWLAAVPDGEFTPYSLASSPEDTARHAMLEFLVKVDGSTRFGARVTTLVPGDRVVVRGPAGSFVLPKNLNAASLLFIAGGTGIAPLRSMIRHALDSGFHNRLSLVYSARTPEEFAYLAELRRLAADGVLELHLTLTGGGESWAHGRGRIDRERLAPLVAASEVFAFICGPTSMLVEVSGTLKELGLPDDQIRTETW
jgi:sulfhydrogenase subunit gamma (sulfur reductase)